MSTWSSTRLDALTAAFFLAFAIGALFSLASWVVAAARRGGRAGSGRAAARGAGRSGGRGAGRAGGSVGGRMGGVRGLFGRLCAPLCDMGAWAALLCAGGGVGYMLRSTGHGALVSLAVALPSGLAAGYVLGALVELLREDTRYVAPFSAEGTVATVVGRIGASTIGEVHFVSSGARRALPAASESGRPIDCGTEVVVVGAERGIARVAPTEDSPSSAPTVARARA